MGGIGGRDGSEDSGGGVGGGGMVDTGGLGVGGGIAKFEV